MFPELHRALTAADQGNDEQDQEEEETDFGYGCGGTGQSSKSEYASDEGDNNKSKCPGEHRGGWLEVWRPGAWDSRTAGSGYAQRMPRECSI